MEKPNLKFNLFTRRIRLMGSIAFSFFLLADVFPQALYAAIVVKKVSFDAEAEKIVWREENGRLKIDKSSQLNEKEILPDGCRICVTKGEVVVEQNGKEVKIFAGESFDPEEAEIKKAGASYVKVAEGRVEYQEQLEHKSVRKALGDPILVDKGTVLVRVNDCYHFETMTISEFADFQVQNTSKAAQAAPPPILPSDEIGDEGTPPSGTGTTCASGPC